MNDELQEAWDNALSVESIEHNGGSRYGLEYIGGILRQDRLYKFYKDANGEYWYSSEKRR